MKHIGLWILLFVAVLIPATASIAASAMYPEMVKPRHEQQRQDAGERQRDPGSKSLAHGLKDAHQAAGLAQGSGLDADCCDANACIDCVTCSACFSVAFVAERSTAEVLPIWAPLPASPAPRAEFLLSGQERPPRLA